MWMKLREKNISIVDYLKRYNAVHVAVYGYGMLAGHLILELEGTDIKIDYIIDKSRRRDSLKEITVRIQNSYKVRRKYE